MIVGGVIDPNVVAKNAMARFTPEELSEFFQGRLSERSGAIIDEEFLRQAKKDYCYYEGIEPTEENIKKINMELPPEALQGMREMAYKAFITNHSDAQ